MDKLERVARAIDPDAFEFHDTCAVHWDRRKEYAMNAAQAAIAALEPVTVRTCAKCGHPENNHPYRHPFVALAEKE